MEPEVRGNSDLVEAAVVEEVATATTRTQAVAEDTTTPAHSLDVLMP